MLGSPPLRWRIVGGRLPVGLRLTRGERITGIPQRLGSFTIEVKGALKKLPSLSRPHHLYGWW